MTAIFAFVEHVARCEADPVARPDGIGCRCRGEVHATTLTEFIENNSRDEGACDAARSLVVDRICELGGGAAPRFTLWRLA